VGPVTHHMTAASAKRGMRRVTLAFCKKNTTNRELLRSCTLTLHANDHNATMVPRVEVLAALVCLLAATTAGVLPESDDALRVFP
jgi:hypothetical protein